MNKRQTKKAKQKKLHNFIHNINQEHKDLREDYYQLAFYHHCRDSDDDDLTDLCLCDTCVIGFDTDVHHTAWRLYKETMKDRRYDTRIINLGSRKINIHLSTEGSCEPQWTLGRDVGCKEDVFNALTEEEKIIVIMHPYFHKY